MSVQDNLFMLYLFRFNKNKVQTYIIFKPCATVLRIILNNISFLSKLHLACIYGQNMIYIMLKRKGIN